MTDDARNQAVEALLGVTAEELVADMARLQAAAEDAGLTPTEVGETLNRRADLPRPLLDSERVALLAILDAQDFPGRDALRAQAASALVDGYCGCGCASVDLRVDDGAPRAVGTPSPIPNGAQVNDAAGEPIGGIIVFLDEGRLSLLEIFAYEDPISPIPPLNRLVSSTGRAWK
jgi:hypothetical protein